MLKTLLRRRPRLILGFIVTVIAIFLLVQYIVRIPDESYLVNFNGSSADLPFQTVLDKVSEIVQCHSNHNEKQQEPSFAMFRDGFKILVNYAQADTKFECHESITYTTMGDFTFLDNLEPLVERWHGPLSVAIYAPGEDFKRTVESIKYLRDCSEFLIKEYVTFHVFFDAQYEPEDFEYSPPENLCKTEPPFRRLTRRDTYRAQNGLYFPINVARNVARGFAETHFVLASDIELYPTPHFIPDFLAFVAENPRLFGRDHRSVFVLPVFEVLKNEQPPETKTELRAMFAAKKAFWFHKDLCSWCHSVPHGDDWIRTPQNGSLNVFSATKRQGLFGKWEPFYVGTNREPFWDERLVWEGESNKMSQVFEMCLLNYDFFVLNDAFLVHKPGVKVRKIQEVEHSDVREETSLILINQLRTELLQKYGTNHNCHLQGSI